MAAAERVWGARALAGSLALLLALLLLPPLSSAAAQRRRQLLSGAPRAVPGLYGDVAPLVTSLQDLWQFNHQLGLLADPEAPVAGAQPAPGPHEPARVSIVQFYMATCPDCQGFSPYFKRLAADLGRHWGRLVRFFVVNCNDDLNINLCWRHNPKLTVPLVRWYAPSGLLAPPSPASSPANGSEPTSGRRRLVSVSHRDFVKRQRRDHVSLRRATVRFARQLLDELKRSSSELYERLPLVWRQLRPLESELERSQRQLSRAQLARALELRQAGVCRPASTGAHSSLVKPQLRLLLLEGSPDSLAGPTLAMDWSNYTDSSNSRLQIEVHYTLERSWLEPLASLSSQLSANWVPTAASAQLVTSGPLLFQLICSGNSSQPELELLSSPGQLESASGGRRRRRNQPASGQHPLENTENINWAPDELNGRDEFTRARLNQAVMQRLLLLFAGNLGPLKLEQPPGMAGQLGEIAPPTPPPSNSTVVAPELEDASLVRLTDYYKLLGQLLNQNLLSRAHLGASQLSAGACWLATLERHFPWQGAGSGQGQSRARLYVELLQKELSGELKLTECSRPALELSELSGKPLQEKQLPAVELGRRMRQLRGQHRLSLPEPDKLRWSYCAGSADHLRGHTCSLWLLFHTLTAHEYLAGGACAAAAPAAPASEVASANATTAEPGGSDELHQEYRFVVMPSGNTSAASGGPLSSCNPMNPEPALLNASPRSLLVRELDFALANVVNFVRFFMSCTNCAAHFSCMAGRAQLFEAPRVGVAPLYQGEGRDACQQSAAGDHLLWLWEAHNWVNVRTRASHSEDPLHPKHVFPAYKACPSCYLAEPTAEQVRELRFGEMRFDRGQLIKFLSARYGRSGILNNKIHIEQLYQPDVTE